VFLPSVGRRPGAGGSQWYTTVWVHNPNAAAVNLTFYLLERDMDNSAAQIYNDTLPAGDVRRYDNAIWTMFAREVFGALRVVASDKVIVNSRIYSLAAGGEQKDSVGQFFAAVPASFAIGSGQRTQILGVYETSPTDTSEFRYNFGFVETAGANATVTVTVYDETGASIGTKSYSLRPYEQRQFRFPTEFASLSTINARIQAEITGGTGKAVVFGSGVANNSTDPSTFEMSFDDALLGAAGGLTSVAHDATLTGDGTGLSPLGLANAAVTKTKLSAAGGSAGQVLGTNGSNLQWQADAGLTLPFSQTTSTTTSAAAFDVKNSGTGWAAKFEITNASATYPALVGSTQGNGICVYGTGAANAVGVRGYSASDHGVEGESSSSMGVWGKSSNSNGVYGESSGSTAVYGKSTSTARGTSGVRGEGNVGVDGYAANGYGVQAISDGLSANTGFSFGIGAFNLCDSCAADKKFAGYFSGNVAVTGTLSKGGGSFKIDHPTDPELKYLYHSFVESPDMMNIYNGNVTTDGRGLAVVELPEWFDALNRDFRYQLTVIGQFAQAIVAEEIAGNRFTIQTDRADVKVSWQVTGVRKDAWANANRIPVEQNKPANEQGFYLHPEAFGQPVELGIDWARDPEGMRELRQRRGNSE
jgi:hypothetical protein